jgi:hypothetical protein
MRKYRPYIVTTIIVLAGIAFWMYREYTRKNVDLTNANPDFTIAAPTLIKEFETNDSVANEKFLGRTLLVSGALREFTRDGNYITLILGGDTASMSSVRCAMDTSHAIKENEFVKGASVDIKGNCTGYNKNELLGSDVIMNRCVVVKP